MMIYDCLQKGYEYLGLSHHYLFTIIYIVSKVVTMPIKSLTFLYDKERVLFLQPESISFKYPLVTESILFQCAPGQALKMLKKKG